MRYRESCPNCGLELDREKGRMVKQRQHNTLAVHENIIVKKCPRCGYVEGEEDELTEPWRKEADLSDETP